MSRRNFDTTLSWAGLLLAGVLVCASALLFWGHVFVDNQIHNQLSAQQIRFPAAGSPALAPAAIGPYLNRYAGQELVNGAQAEAYADHFIAVHLSEIAGGKTYAQVSTLAKAQPTDTALSAQAQTLFQGETLRGLLLTAYAFWRIGQLALIGSIVALVVGLAFAVLSILGFRHLRHTDVDEFIDIPLAGAPV